MDESGFVQATAKSLGVIFASEIGDKTFFIAALMAMRHPRTLVRLSVHSSQKRALYARCRFSGPLCAFGHPKGSLAKAGHGDATPRIYHFTAC
jgi:hypothetical protein